MGGREVAVEMPGVEVKDGNEQEEIRKRKRKEKRKMRARMGLDMASILTEMSGLRI